MSKDALQEAGHRMTEDTRKPHLQHFVSEEEYVVEITLIKSNHKEQNMGEVEGLG